MSYLFEETTTDELLLLMAKESNDGVRPKPDDVRIDGMPRGKGFCWLNMTDNLYTLHRNGYIRENRIQGFVVNLTWKAWDRIDQLLADGKLIPTDEQVHEYAVKAMSAVERGEKIRPVRIGKPPHVPFAFPRRDPDARPNFLLRLFGVKSGA